MFSQYDDFNQSATIGAIILKKYHPTETPTSIFPQYIKSSPIDIASLYITPPVIISAIPPPNMVDMNAPLKFSTIPFILSHPICQFYYSLNPYRKKSDDKSFARAIIANYMLSSIGGRESDINNLSSFLIPTFQFLVTASSPPLVNQPSFPNPFVTTPEYTEPVFRFCIKESCHRGGGTCHR